MFTTKEKSVVVAGKPWTNAAVFEDFEGADSLRKQILEKISKTENQRELADLSELLRAVPA